MTYKVSCLEELPKFGITGSFALKVYRAQVTRDLSIQQLIEEMDESCKAAKEAMPLRDRSPHSNDIVVKILLQVIQCAYFVKGYCSKHSFGVCDNSFESLIITN